MNLKQALGITDWQSLDATSLDATYLDPSVIFCVGEELADCWYSEEDPRWQLLSNITRALGVDLTALEPAEPDDLPEDSSQVWQFDGVHLPLLSEMLVNPALKAQLWQTLCPHIGRVSA